MESKFKIIFIFFMLFCFFGCLIPNQKIDQNTSINDQIQEEDLTWRNYFDPINSAILNLEKYNEYSWEYVEELGGYKRHIFVSKNDTLSYVNVKTIFDEKEFFYNDTEIVVCVNTYKTEKKCTMTGNNLELLSFAANHRKNLITGLSLTRKYYEVIFQNNALELKKFNIDDENINLIYSPRFENLSISNMNLIGVNPNDPLLRFKDFTYNISFNKNKGYLDFYSYTYTDNNQSYFFNLNTINFSNKSNIPKIDIDIMQNDSLVVKTLLDISSNLNTYINCYRGIDVDECIRKLAFNLNYINLCKSISEIDKINSCELILVTKLNDPKNCEKINEKDICYYEFAFIENDINLCEKINDEDIKNDCIILFN